LSASVTISITWELEILHTVVKVNLARERQQLYLLLFDLGNRSNQPVFAGQEIDLRIPEFELGGDPQSKSLPSDLSVFLGNLIVFPLYLQQA